MAEKYSMSRSAVLDVDSDEDYLRRIDIWDTNEPIGSPNLPMRNSRLPNHPFHHPFPRDVSLHKPFTDVAVPFNYKRRPINSGLQELLKTLERFVASCGPGTTIQLGRNQPGSSPEMFVTTRRPMRPTFSNFNFTNTTTDDNNTEPRRSLETYFGRGGSFDGAVNHNVGPPGRRDNHEFRGAMNNRAAPPLLLTPDEFILRELADIRRLLLQRFLSQGGNLQNLDPHDEILDILGVLTDEEGDPDEPPPHFPVGEWVWVECEVCFEFRWLYRRVCCAFPVCSDCLRRYFATKVSDGIVKIECCNPQCHTFVHRDEVSARLEVAMKRRFHQYLVQANQNPYTKTCPRCNHIHSVPRTNVLKSTKNDPDRSRVKCLECQLPWCFPCHCPWHSGLTCKQFRRGDRLLKNWAQEMHHGQRNAQRCPKCKVFIQRTSGCDHMHCARCKTDFCYRCGDKLRKLKFFGDHYSKFSIFGCKFRFKANQPVQRKVIRGAIFGGKLLVAPIVGTLGACAGVVAMSLGIFALPVYGGLKLYRRYEAQHHPRVPRLPQVPGTPTILSGEELPLPTFVPRSPTYHPNSGSIVFNI